MEQLEQVPARRQRNTQQHASAPDTQPTSHVVTPETACQHHACTLQSRASGQGSYPPLCQSMSRYSRPWSWNAQCSLRVGGIAVSATAIRAFLVLLVNVLSMWVVLKVVLVLGFRRSGKRVVDSMLASVVVHFGR